jgi:hypothetical protein
MQTVNVTHFQGKIKLSGFSAYPDVSPSQLILMSGVVVYLASEGKDTKIKIANVRKVENRGICLYDRK